MRKDMLFKYFIVGIFIFLLDLIYRKPSNGIRLLIIITFTIILGIVIERLYYYMLARKQIKLLLRLCITVPLSVLFMLLYTWILDRYSGIHLYIIVLTVIGAVVLDQVNYRIYKHSHKQVNDLLSKAKAHVTHNE